jgi:hypothetical protein
LKHFADEAWADFARSVIAPEQRTAMEKHIDEGCRECAAMLILWDGVFSIAQRESVFTPPVAAVRLVKANFPGRALQPKAGFRLLFDSNLQPVTAGLRGASSARQLLFETNDYYIDLRLEPRCDAEQACVVGQILHRMGRERSTEGLAIRVQKGKDLLAQTTANRFGEFQLRFPSAEDICIAIGGKEETRLILPFCDTGAKLFNQKDLDSSRTASRRRI